MESTQIIVIVSLLAAIALVSMFYAVSTAEEIKEEKKPVQKFEPGKISYPRCNDSVEAEKPKNNKKKYYKKKKPAVANNATTQKKPVGRPKKSN